MNICVCENKMESSSSSLTWWHGVSGAAHLGQAAMALSLTNGKYKDKGEFEVTNGGETLFKYKLGNLVATFPLLSSVNHIWSTPRSFEIREFRNFWSVILISQNFNSLLKTF